MQFEEFDVSVCILKNIAIKKWVQGLKQFLKDLTKVSSAKN